MYVHIHSLTTCIYTYIHVDIHIHVYIHIYMWYVEEYEDVEPQGKNVYTRVYLCGYGCVTVVYS